MPKQDVTVELFYDSAWHDLVAADDVYAEPITIMRGNSDESAAPRPATVELQLANDDDLYRTTNPESPLYGKAGVNTPLRVSTAGTVRAHVEASSFAAAQSMSFQRHPKRGKAWVDVEAGGALQRINQWSEKLNSPFYQYNADLPGLLGYWSHEDRKGTRSLFTPVPGSTSTSLRGAEFEQDRFAGSAPLAELENNSNARSGGRFAPTTASDTDGWQVSFTIKPGSLGTTGDAYNFFSFTTRNGVSYALVFVDGNSILLLADEVAAGVNLITNSQSLTGLDTNWNLWQNFIVRATYSGGTTTINIYYNTEGSDAFVNWSDSFTGVTSQPSVWAMVAGDAQNTVGIGHVVGMSGTTPNFFSVERLNAFKGHVDETAADRFDRLCTLKNVPFTILGTAADSYPMGPQGYGLTLAEHFEEIKTTEDGLIFDDIDAIGLVLMLRNHRYNQTPALTLNAGGEDHGMPSLPVEVTDDLGIHNMVTAKQRDGGEYTAEDSTSPMGTQPPPDGRNEYRQTVDVNVADQATGLLQQAWWWLYRGTVNLPRYPKLTINMAALDAAKLAEVEAVDVGNVIEITGYRENTIRLHVLGYTETIGRSDAERSITFTCAPDQQFQVGVWDDTDSRWDSKTCTLAEDLTTTETLWDVTADEWADTFADPGSGSYPVTLGGEVCELTNATAPAGAGPFTQTLTCRRSRNGIVKTHQTGDRITVATPGRWGL